MQTSRPKRYHSLRGSCQIACLIAAGADPDAFDNSGVAPLHRAVRNRSVAAAGAMIQHGADPLLRNKRGSTPLHLAVQNTGKSNSGSEACRLAQVELIALLRSDPLTAG